MNTKFKALQIKRQFLIDKHVVGIDPAKARQQAAIVDCHGMLSGKPFTFANSLDGYENLLRKVKLQTADVNAEGIVFAIEAGLRITSGKPLKHQTIAPVLMRRIENRLIPMFRGVTEESSGRGRSKKGTSSALTALAMQAAYA